LSSIRATKRLVDGGDGARDAGVGRLGGAERR
jgi:hypothetical protein